MNNHNLKNTIKAYCSSRSANYGHFFQLTHYLKNIVLIVSFSVAYFIFLNIAFAQDIACQNIYGGGKLCASHPDLTINMQVQEPDNAQFREGITAQSNYYSAGDIVTFKITITNKSNKNLSDIDVVYTFPPYTTGGNQTNTFTKNIPSLEKGKTTAFSTQARIVSAKLPLSSAVCLTNYAEVRQGGKVGSDVTPFCIDNSEAVASAQSVATSSAKGLPVYGQTKLTKTPATGPETLVLLGGLGSFVSGLMLRKKSFY